MKVAVSPLQPQTVVTELRPCYLFQWKYQCKWLISPHSYSLQPQSHYHATCFGESICKSGLSVHNSHRLKAQRYLHATYLSRSICKSGLSVDDSHRLQHRATYSGGSTCESGLPVHTVTDCSHRAISMLLFLMEVSVNVACRSTTATD